MPREERSFRTKALILRRRDFGEADRLITVLTPERGRFDAIAKGARKPNSTKTGHVELFTRADVLIHKGRSFDLAVQVEMVEPFLPLREDLIRGAYASYAAELLERLTEAGEEDPQPLYHLLNDTFERLSNDPDPRLALRYYELYLLDLAGFRPELQHCVIGRDIIEPQNQYFSYAGGGVVCPAHGADNPVVLPITVPTLKLMRHMQRSPYSHVRALVIEPALHDDIERVLLGYILYLLERKLESVDFIRQLRRQTAREQTRLAHNDSPPE